MATSISVYPRLGTTYLDANNVPITAAGATVPVSAYIDDALRRQDVSTTDPLNVYQPEDRTGTFPSPFAPVNAEYLVSTANATLTNERVLTAGTGITLTPGAGTLTVASTAGGAPSNATYVCLSADGALSNERVLTGGAGISITDGGPGGPVTIAAVGGGGGGAPTDASYVVIGANAGLSNERVLTAGTGIAIGGDANTVLIGATNYDATFVTLSTHANVPNERVLTAGTGISLADGGPGGALTISATGGGGGAPTNVQYVTLATDATLTNERVLTAGTGISIVDGGAGGNVTISNTGAPVNAEYLVSTANGTLTNERVLTAGANITLTPGSGTLTIAATGGGGSGATGFLSVLDQGVVQGALGNNTARANNRTAFNNAIALAASSNKILLVPPGTYEIHGGALICASSQFRWLGSTNSIILQYQLNAPVMHCGAPLGTVGSAHFGSQYDGVFLRYAGTATAGGNALEITGPYMCEFKNFLVGDPYATLAGRTSVPYIGVYIDEVAGTIPAFSNKFENFHIKHFGYIGWSQYRLGFDASTGNHYSNIYIGGGDNAGQQDLSGVNGMGMLLGSCAQSVFNQLNIEWLKAPSPLKMEVVNQMVFNSVNFEGLSLKAGSSQNLGFIDAYIGNGVFNGLTIADCRSLTGDNCAAASVFRVGPGSTISVDNLRIRQTTDTAAGPYAIVRNFSGSGDNTVRFDLQHVILGDGDALDQFDAFTFSAGNEGGLFGVLSDFNNLTPITLSNANATHYTYGGPGVLRMAPSGGNKTITLSRQCTSAITARIPRGVTRRVHCVAGSASSVVVANYNAATLITLAAGASAEVAFDGTDWVLV